MVILFLLAKLINSEQLACYASAITPFPRLWFPSLSLSLLTPPLPLLPIYYHQLCQCFKTPAPIPHPDLWHCLFHQLPSPSLINFDVEPNEIRLTIEEAVADSWLIYPSAQHCHATLTNESSCSLDTGGISLHEFIRLVGGTVSQQRCSMETLYITAHVALKRKWKPLGVEISKTYFSFISHSIYFFS